MWWSRSKAPEKPNSVEVITAELKMWRTLYRREYDQVCRYKVECRKLNLTITRKNNHIKKLQAKIKETPND